MVNDLLKLVENINLSAEPLDPAKIRTYEERISLSATDCCYGADCGDCDCGGYCIDPDDIYTKSAPLR